MARIAAGEPLPLKQEQIFCRGHAIEVRLYAEDPQRDFLPSTGRLTVMSSPAEPGVRIDTGVRAGDAVSVHYDPLIAKLIAWGGDREIAVRRLSRALADQRVGGIATNLALFRRILSDPAFEQAQIDTGYLDRLLAEKPAPSSAPSASADAEIVALAAAVFSNLDPASGNGMAQKNGSAANGKCRWKLAARNEAVRSS